MQLNKHEKIPIKRDYEFLGVKSVYEWNQPFEDVKRDKINTSFQN